MSEQSRNKGRMAIYAMAGFYLLYLAKDMFQAILTSSGNEKILMIVFTVLFVIAGAGLMIFGIFNGYRLMKNPVTDQAQEDAEEENTDLLETEAKADEIEMPEAEAAEKEEKEI